MLVASNRNTLPLEIYALISSATSSTLLALVIRLQRHRVCRGDRPLAAGCLLGPSGCAKASTPRMIVGHEAISEGDIFILDSNVTNLPPLECGPSMIVRSNARLPYLASPDNVVSSLTMHGLEASAVRARHRLHSRQPQPERGDALTDVAPVFTSGRNILRGPRGPIADRCRLGATGDGPPASPPSTTRAARFASSSRSTRARTPPSSSATRPSPPSPALWRFRDTHLARARCSMPSSGLHDTLSVPASQAPPYRS